MLKKNIRSQVLIPLTLTFIILTGCFVYTTYRIRMDDYERGLDNRYQRVQLILNNLIANHTSYMTSAIEFIADQNQFQDAMRAKERGVLLKHGSPILKRLFSQQQITHFYFYDEYGAIVLRVYNPDDKSASMPRFTKQQAMAQGRTVSGLELGRSGTFTLRVVYPWKVNKKLIGYIELGQEYDHILKELNDFTLADFVVALDKQHLDRAAWEEGMQMLGRNADWNLLPDRVLIDQTATIPPRVVATFLATDQVSGKNGRKLEVHGRTYHANSFPLLDVAQKPVGKFVLFADLTDNISSFRVFIVQVASFSLLVCAGLFFYSFQVLGRVDRRLLENRQQLGIEFEKQAETNKQLEFEVIERRRAEESLVTLNEYLEQRVLDRTNELRQLNLQLEASHAELEEAYRNLQTHQATIQQQDRMACIGQLAASVAHDINNPIGFVAGNLEVLKNYWNKLAAFVAIQHDVLQRYGSAEWLRGVEEHRRRLKVDYVLEEFSAVLDESLEGTERVNTIVLNLKGFSRMDEKEARLADIHGCLESTLNIVWNKLRYKADIKKEYGDIPHILCYPQQLNQVFMNLLINASQSIGQWGEIKIRTWSDRENIFVAIADTGCGIAEENLPKLFEPFFTTKESGVGTGLGLSIVREIVNKHHGDITVVSVPGEGTVFTVHLPLGKLPQVTNHA
ncbi:MAG: ATP-binding protein [Desulfuromonadaceae bacterium]|nr:ATP-binding protein [Desulfuromonadaceae bacterium]